MSEAEELFERGREAHRLRDFSAAVEALERAVALEPSRVEWWWQLGASSELAGDFDEMERAYAKMLELADDASTSGFAHRGLGRAKAARGRHQEAIVHFEAATADDDFLYGGAAAEEVFLDLARSFEQLGRDRDAASAYESFQSYSGKHYAYQDRIDRLRRSRR